MSLLVECLPDETTVVALGIPPRAVTHYSGKDELCKALTRTQGLMAMMDEDPFSSQPPYLKTLRDAEAVLGIKLLVDNDRNHRLIVVCPRLEDWLFAATKEAKIPLSDFGFVAKEPRSLHAEINDRL